MSMKRAVTRHTYVLLLIVFLAGGACDSAPTPNKTIYSNTSNKELKQKALRVVKSIRELADSYNTKDRELRAEYDKKDKPEIRIDERKAMRDQWIKESDAVHDSAMRSYKENYWADAILLRNELYKRLPKQQNQKDLAPIGYALKAGQLTYDCRYSTMHGMPVTGGRGFRSLKPLWYNGVPP